MQTAFRPPWKKNWLRRKKGFVSRRRLGVKWRPKVPPSLKLIQIKFRIGEIGKVDYFLVDTRLVDDTSNNSWLISPKKKLSTTLVSVSPA